MRRYNQEGLEALKEQRHQNPGQKPKPEGSFLRASLGYPVAHSFAPQEASFPLSLPAGFMRRGPGILRNSMHASPRPRPFWGSSLREGPLTRKWGTCTSSGPSRTMEA